MSARIIATHQLPYGGVYDLMLPRGTLPLTVGVVHAVATLWVTSPADAARKNDDNVKRTVHIVDSGATVPEKAIYVGTILVDNGYTIAHVFLEPEVVS